MPEPLKNLYTKELITRLGYEISKHDKTFNQKKFTHSVFDKSWDEKELKQRMRHIAVCLHQQLPANYKKAMAILKPVSEKFLGFEYMFFQDYVECYGLDDVDDSLSALAHFTQYASSEFAIRAFIMQDQKNTMQQMHRWAKSDNHHLRRLASEGCRPRLPWAMALPAFKHNPKPVFALLKGLMQDESEYVRRSVANNLNDISKDHPDQVLDWADNWLGKNKNTDWIIKHACRTLLKQGEQRALSLFGFADATHINVRQFQLQSEVCLGEKLHFSFVPQTKNHKLGKCRIEFAIDFVKANGRRRKKVFKIAEGDYEQPEKNVEKYFSFKKISTRKYYPGEHSLSIIINGISKAEKTFFLR